MGITHPELDNYIVQVIKKCGQCLQFNPMKRVSIQPALRARRPWYHIQIDLIGPLPESDGNRYILIAVDVFSSYVHLTALKTKSHEQLSKPSSTSLLNVELPRSFRQTTAPNSRTVCSSLAQDRRGRAPPQRSVSSTVQRQG
jgi:hypothetical protein